MFQVVSEPFLGPCMFVCDNCPFPKQSLPNHTLLPRLQVSIQLLHPKTNPLPPLRRELYPDLERNVNKEWIVWE